jgi:NADPH:quinone reductase-like Zn-dependent oxidoreductase
MSRMIKFAQAGGPEVLEFIETEIPAPGPHEVRIKVKAIGINRADFTAGRIRRHRAVRLRAPGSARFFRGF